MTWTFEIKNGDMVRDPTTGSYKQLEKEAKAEQDIKMTLSTDIRDIIITGTGLDQAVGMDTSNPVDAMSAQPVLFDFQMLVHNGLERLRRTQRRYLFSRRTPYELINDFTPVQLWPDRGDYRIIKWNVDVFTVAGRITISGTTNVT